MSNGKIAMALLILFIMMSSIPNGLANHSHGKCHYCEQGGGDEMPSLKEKYFMKVHFLMKHRDELGLSEPQIQSIMDKKFDIKKVKIDTEAKTKTALLDIYREIQTDNPDLKRMQDLVDAKIEAKRTEGKTLVEAILYTKSILSPEQQAKAKQIYWREKFPTEPYPLPKQ